LVSFRRIVRGAERKEEERKNISLSKGRKKVENVGWAGSGGPVNKKKEKASSKIPFL